MCHRAGQIGASASAAVLRLAEDIRLFFDGTIAIGSTGLDGPFKGDLHYQASFDYNIEIPRVGCFSSDLSNTRRRFVTFRRPVRLHGVSNFLGVVAMLVGVNALVIGALLFAYWREQRRSR